MVLDDYICSFITYELPSGIYTFTFKSFFYRNLQSEPEGVRNTIDTEFDDSNLKTQLVLRHGIIAVRFDEKSFLSTFLGFIPHWDYKHYNEYISQKLRNLSTRDKIHLNCDITDESIVIGLRQPILFSFLLV